jgi:hypothetical protein
MNVHEMAEKIYQIIKDLGPSCTFKEMQDRCGDEANGDFQFSLPGRPNTILWGGVSEMFIDAFFSLRGRIEPYPSCVLIYMMDGAVLRMPVAKRPSKTKDYKTPHWAPAVFGIRQVKEPSVQP